MRRTNPEQRRLMAEAVKRGKNKNVVADVFGVCLRTVKKWCKRKRFKDKRRKAKQSKITVKVELSILALRSLDWGTERIQKGLFCLPKFVREAVGVLVRGIKLSRPAINDVLKKHKLNGYKEKCEGWKFFRAEKPNELWQLDIKGPFKVQSKKYYFVICIDDFSRYLVLAEQLSHDPTENEIRVMLMPLVKKHHPESILTDNNPFKKEWDQWCKGNGIKPLHAHPYYPQDKGKVERTIRNVAEEFIYLLKKFPEWLNGKLKDYKKWFNTKRYHQGVKAIPYQLYT